MTRVVFQDKISAANLAVVVDVCNRLKIHPNWLMGVMNFESGLRPSALNDVSGSVGLIQFTRDKKGVDYKTINGRKYYLDALRSMTFAQQMEVVYEYLKGYAPKIKSFTDCYLAIFFPVAMGKPMNYVLETANLSASLIARQNPIFDTNKDAKITKTEVLDFFKNRYTEVFDELNVGGSKSLYKIVAYVVGVFFYSGFAVWSVNNL